MSEGSGQQRPVQFGLGGLLVAVTILAVALAWSEIITVGIWLAMPLLVWVIPMGLLIFVFSASSRMDLVLRLILILLLGLAAFAIIWPAVNSVR
jgi:hypothetical protein